MYQYSTTANLGSGASLIDLAGVARTALGQPPQSVGLKQSRTDSSQAIAMAQGQAVHSVESKPAEPPSSSIPAPTYSSYIVGAWLTVGAIVLLLDRLTKLIEVIKK